MLPGEPSLTIILLLELVCVLAYFLKGFSGFGPAIVLVPTVTLLIGPQIALVNSALIDLVVGVTLMGVFDYKPDDWRLIGTMAGLVAIGALIGGMVVGIIPTNVVSTLIGVFVLFFSLWLLIGDDHDNREGKTVYLWLGSLLGGFTGGLVGISGPFIVAGARPLLDKTTFRRVIVPVFVVGNIFKLLGYISSDVWSSQVPWLSLTLAPGIMAGLFLGYLTHPRVDERVFNMVIGGILIILSLRVLLPLLGV